MLDVDYWDLIYVQASLMMITVILSMSKHPWWWLRQFDPCLSILDNVDWDSIKVQASILMIIAIWSVSKHAWCWLLGFDPCPSILDDVDWDSINVQASLMMIIVIWSASKHSWWWLLKINPLTPEIQKVFRFLEIFIYIAKGTWEEHKWNFITVYRVVSEIWHVTIWSLAARTSTKLANIHSHHTIHCEIDMKWIQP